MKSIEDLEVFKIAGELGLSIYKITKNFPKDENFGLISQMRRSAISICSNLAEGGSRATSGELRQFIGIARGSAGELKFQILFSYKLGYMKKEDFDIIYTTTERVHKMLTGLIKTV